MRIGIMSLAHLHADAYLPLLQHMPEVEVVGVYDDDEQRGKSCAMQHQIGFFSTPEALLNEGLDAVVICSENSRHRELTELAALAGAHILCEKPLATSVADAEQMVQICREANVLLMTAFPMRFSIPLIEVKQQIDAGALGQIYCFETTNQGEMPAHHRAWFVDKALAGGGALTDHIVHIADVLRWYLQSEIVEVYAQENRILHADAVDVETGGLVMLTFANGVFASIDCSWSRPASYPTWGGLSIELICERGALLVDAFRQHLVSYDQGQRGVQWMGWGSDANRAMLEEFVAAVREQRPPAVTGEDGLRAVEVVQAAYRSVASGLPERV